MSVTVDLSSEYLSFGFCRESEKSFKIYVPDSAMKLVHKYNVKYLILANADGNDHCLFGIGSQQRIRKWVRLKQLESLLPSIDNLFINGSSIFVINAMQKIYVAGRNTFSRLGIKRTRQSSSSISTFTEVCNKHQPMICSSGIGNICHTFIYLMNDNKLFANGSNLFGGFGNGQKTAKNCVFSEIKPFWNKSIKIRKILCARFYSLFLIENGHLYACGLKDNSYASKPKRIKANVEDISAGCKFHIILYQNGQIEAKGRAASCNLNAVNQYFQRNKIKIKQISSGGNHAAVLSANNECFTFGDNEFGQCGNGERSGSGVSRPHCIQLGNDHYVTKVCGGDFHSLLLTNRNDVYGFGSNENHQISAVVEDEVIVNPYLLDKQTEMKLNQSSFICDVIAMTDSTLVVVDPSRRVLLNKTSVSC